MQSAVVECHFYFMPLPASSPAHLREKSGLLTPLTLSDSFSIYKLRFVFDTFPYFLDFPKQNK